MTPAPPHRPEPKIVRSPVERECLCVLLRGPHPGIVAPARTPMEMRLPEGCRRPLEEGRLLVLPRFPETRRRACSGT